MPNKKPTKPKPIIESDSTKPDKALAAITNDVEALKRDNEELRTLIRYLAEAVELAPKFLIPQADRTAMERWQTAFTALIREVLSQTKRR